MCLAEFYCGVIARSHLQLINTLIDNFFSKLHTFLEEGRTVMDKRKLDGTVDEFSAEQQILKFNAIAHNM